VTLGAKDVQHVVIRHGLLPFEIVHLSRAKCTPDLESSVAPAKRRKPDNRGMGRKNLLEFFEEYYAAPSECLIYDDGYRRWTYTYANVARAAGIFAARLQHAHIDKGEKIILWSENRPEWLFAFWGCLLTGVVVVPIGGEATIEFVRRVQDIVQARVIAVGDEPHLDSGFDIPVWRLTEADWNRPAASISRPKIQRNECAEIMFTSGSTADPKGVVITHGNLLAEVEGAEPAVKRYRKLATLFSPLRLLQLLPFSHMFGQATTLILPPMIPCSIVITQQQSLAAIPALIRDRRVTAAVSVPRSLHLMQLAVVQITPEASGAEADKRNMLLRLWKYRRIHRLFGWKFLGFIVGGAALERQVEDFWSALGFLVIQGYGLTETSPVVTLNHPLHPQPGSAGKPLPGVEVKIAPDGEVLVRGGNVTPGYYDDPPKTAETIEGGWLHTGDLGEFDRDGHLYIRGRKKEVIVTPEGLNIFPEDIERVIDAQPGVRESAVVGLTTPGNGEEEQLHALLVLRPRADAQRIIGAANRQLQGYQRIRHFSIWSEDSLPRTAGTFKLKRGEIRNRLATVAAGASPARAGRAREVESVEGTIERHTGREATTETRLDELGLGSVDQIELLLDLEQRYQRRFDEREFFSVQTVGDLEAVVERVLSREEGRFDRAGSPIAFSKWTRGWPARAVRRLNQMLWILPVTRLVSRPVITGRDRLRGLEPPVIFAANHQSHIDTPLILGALPARWRYRIAPAMYQEYFNMHYHPEGQPLGLRLLNSLEYYLVAALFNAFPIPQEEPGARETLRYAGDLASDGWSILIFPEGERRPSGKMGDFRAGVGLLASRLKLPVIPIRLEGTDRVLPRGRMLPCVGRTRVIFGNPILLTGENPKLGAKRVAETIIAL